MRQFKFRAWDKHLKEIVYKFCIGSVTNVDDDLWTCPTVWTGTGWVNNDMLEIMQYTGLKDINGKEIYEGDIVKILERDWPSRLDLFSELSHQQYLDKLSSLAQVVFSDGRFRLNPITVNNYYCEYAGNNERRDIFEVIGNIHENPELLE